MSDIANWAYTVRERLEEEDYENDAERLALEREYKQLVKRLVSRSKGTE